MKCLEKFSLFLVLILMKNCDGLNPNDPTTTSSSTTGPTTTTSPTTTGPTTTTSPTTTATTTGTTTTTTTGTTTTSTTGTTTTTGSGTTTKAPIVCPASGLFCKDCQNLAVCIQAGSNPVSTISCQAQTGSRPYCDSSTNQCTDTNTCSVSASTTPGTTNGLYTCVRQERRPDPLNCRQYIECVPGTNPNSYVGYAVSCPNGQKYNILLQKCGPFAPCQQISSYCFLRSGVLTQYSPYPSIYAYCPRAGSNEQLLVFQCRGSYIFDPSTSQCRPRCANPGNIPRNENCKQFYTCTRTFFGFRMTLSSCPSGFGFNRQTLRCDPALSNCVSVS